MENDNFTVQPMVILPTVEQIVHAQEMQVVNAQFNAIFTNSFLAGL